MDQVKTVRAQTRALPGKLADHLDLAASFEILPDYGVPVGRQQVAGVVRFSLAGDMNGVPPIAGAGA